MLPAPVTEGALPSVAVLGADALLAALPATPVQLAHACLAAGYTAAFPVSWGDELIAAECTSRAAARGETPAILCACPLVADTLLTVGSDLEQFLIPLVAPPVAVARYLRALYRERVRITYIGGCPSASDPSIDAKLTPTQFLGVLAQLGILPLDQPEVFESVLPPDRRRFRSLPGGAPSARTLAHEAGGRVLVELAGPDVKTELAQRLMANERAVFDLAPALGCCCSGARRGEPAERARASVAAIEPPRSPSEVVDRTIAVWLERPLHRRPSEPATFEPLQANGDAAGREPAHKDLVQPTDPRASEPREPAVERADGRGDERVAGPAAAYTPSAEQTPPGARRRIIAGAVPLRRTDAGRVIPRAYASWKRTPPEGAPVIDGEASLATATPPDPHPRFAPETESPATVPPALEQRPATPAPAVAQAVLAAPAAPATSPNEFSPPPTIRPHASRRPAAPSVVVPLPADRPQPIPPPPARDGARALVLTAAVAALLLSAAVALRRWRPVEALADGAKAVPSVDSGAVAPALGSGFPSPTAEGAVPFPTGRLTPADSGPGDVGTDAPPAPGVGDRRGDTTATPVVRPTTPRRRGAVRSATGRTRPAPVRKGVTPDSGAQARQDSVDREIEAIRRALAERRARLDSIRHTVRSLPGAGPPP